MAQLVASMSGVVLGEVVEVVGSNLARGKIVTASIGSVDSLYPYVSLYIFFLFIFFFFLGGGGLGVSSRCWVQAYVARTDESTQLGGISDQLLSTFNVHV